MARLIDTRTTPPAGWRYVQPETGCEMTGLSFGDLVETVEKHRRYKETGDASREAIVTDIERQMCTALEPRFCRAEPGEDYRPVVDEPGGLTIAKVTAASLAMMQFLKGGGVVVAKEESERRAAICRGCRFNRNADGCGACNVLYSLVEAIVPHGRREPGLKTCAACGCLLKVKVLMPTVVIEAGNAARAIEYPAHCWQKSPSA